MTANIFVAMVLGVATGAGSETAPAVVCRPQVSAQEQLAAKELVRYIYLRTGNLPAVAGQLPGSGDAVVLAIDPALGKESFTLATARREGRRVWTVTGGSPLGVLYGAYRFAEKLGVRFYLHGDVIPDQRLAALPTINESGRPLFDTRGIQPFHDFPEGPDWWNRDDYLAYVSQLAKMRMNFLGLHCYPEKHPDAEPLVWIGQPSDLDAAGHATFAYPARWADTRRVNTWGYVPMKTSEFAAGADRLFAGDVCGPDVQGDLFPTDDASQAVCCEVFHRTADLMAAVVSDARALGVKTCIGTETPLTIPKRVVERLQAQGKDPKDPAVVRSLYEAMFRRIARLYPVDYYWLWMPEAWTWGGNKPEQFAATTRDIQAALDALQALGNPFTLATCGWVLGPQHDRAALDAFLPKNCPMSCINRLVGHAPDEAGFAKLSDRPKWVIPWMENDPNLVAPQPWVGRMRCDAVDARRLGCTGLLGIHWRTKALSGNIAALAAAAWDQSWVPAGADLGPITTRLPRPTAAGPLGGQIVHFKAPVAGTDEQTVYQSVRYGMTGYNLQLPDGRYTVTLKFNEPHYAEAGKRVFAVTLQDKTVIDQLDIFARVGKNKVLDFHFDDIRVAGGWLQIGFQSQVEFPSIAGIVVEGIADKGTRVTRKINCGGARWHDYEDDSTTDAHNDPQRDRAMPADDFYIDFARANFGPSVAEPAGKLLAGIDGTKLPEPCTWIAGPGGIKPEAKPWSELKVHYAFVDDLARLRNDVRGPGNLARFDYWLNTYRAMAAMAELGCARGQLNVAVAKIKQARDAAKKRALAQEALAVRIRMARLWETMLGCQVAATDTPGELGTIVNLEQHNRVHQKFLATYDKELAAALGAPLPAAAEPARAYAGPGRIIVPTVRGLVHQGEALKLRVIALDDAPAGQVELHWRPLGGGSFATVAAQHMGRAVYAVTLPPADRDLEYYVSAVTAAGRRLVWPATAPEICQTVIVQ
jgi:hypothetical protein